MCRHLAYLGPPVTLRSVIIDPPRGLYRQAWAPRMQRHGTVNADGFGVGEFVTVNTRIGAGYNPQSTDFTLTNFKPADLTVNLVTGLTANLSVIFSSLFSPC